MHSVVSVVQPFDFSLSLEFLRGFGPMAGEQEIKRDALIKAWMVRGQEIRVTMRQVPEGLACHLESDGAIDDERTRDICELVRSFTSADEDLSDFYALAARDAAFAPVAKQLRGLHHPKFATPFEAACWSVINQRIQLGEARKMKAAIANGRSAFPEAATIAALTEAELTKLMGHARKARAVWSVAQAFKTVDPKWLQNAPIDEVEAWLLRIYGVGDFASGFILFRGLGRARTLPWSPKFVIAARATYGAKATRISLEKTAVKYGKWLGHWSLYLWAATFVRGREKSVRGTRVDEDGPRLL